MHGGRSRATHDPPRNAASKLASREALLEEQFQSSAACKGGPRLRRQWQATKGPALASTLRVCTTRAHVCSRALWIDTRGARSIHGNPARSLITRARREARTSPATCTQKRRGEEEGGSRGGAAAARLNLFLNLSGREIRGSVHAQRPRDT